MNISWRASEAKAGRGGLSHLNNKDSSSQAAFPNHSARINLAKMMNWAKQTYASYYLQTRVPI